VFVWQRLAVSFLAAKTGGRLIGVGRVFFAACSGIDGVCVIPQIVLLSIIPNKQKPAKPYREFLCQSYAEPFSACFIPMIVSTCASPLVYTAGKQAVFHKMDA
jgi:hypothetical protein